MHENDIKMVKSFYCQKRPGGYNKKKTYFDVIQKNEGYTHDTFFKGCIVVIKKLTMLIFTYTYI